jgi:ATP-dependent DNA ligase
VGRLSCDCLDRDGLHVRSRRGWNMTHALPYFPGVCARVLNGDTSIPVTFVAFDLLRFDGVGLTNLPYAKRRAELDGLSLEGPAWATSEAFEDGTALFKAVCEHGLEGVVAKRLSSRYASNVGRWIKTKKPGLLAARSGAEAVARSRARVRA